MSKTVEDAIREAVRNLLGNQALDLVMLQVENANLRAQLAGVLPPAVVPPPPLDPPKES